MATGDVIDQIRPIDLSPVNAPVGWTPSFTTIGAGVRGIPLRKLDTDVFYFIAQVPANGTPLSTGLTFKVMLAEAPGQDSDPGLVVRLGISVKKLVSATDDMTDAGIGTETFGTVTMPATAGIAVVGSIAILTAAADTPVAGGFILVKLRRNGSNAADTHRRSVILLGITVIDT